MQWLTEETGWLLPENDDPLLWTECAPAQLPALGAGLAGAASCVMVGCGEKDAEKAAAMLLCGGIAAAGGSVCFASASVPAALQAGAKLHHCGILVYCGAQTLILARGLLPLTEAQRRTIQAGSAHPKWMHAPEFGSISDDRSLNGLYAAQLRRRLPAQIPFRAEVQSGAALLCAVLRPVFAGGLGAPLTLRLSADGRRASLYTEETGWIFWEKLLLMCAQQYLRSGQDTALPVWLPHSAEEMAAECGQRVLRCAMQPDGKDADARQLAAAQGFTLDGAVLCADILRFCAEKGLSLREWADSLPECFTVRRILRAEAAADAALRCAPALHAAAEPDGLRVKTAAGEALLHPSRSGRSVSMLVEARSMEAASELAGEIAALVLSEKR